jgi:formyl-CoA transferase
MMPITDPHWDALCTAIDQPELLVDPRFETPQARIHHRAALYELIAGWTRQRDKHTAMRILAAAGVPCSAVLDTVELHADPHLTARGFVHWMDLPEHGRVPLLGFAPRLSESSVALRRAPLLGEHTDEVLAEDLNLPAPELRALHEAGVLG